MHFLHQFDRGHLFKFQILCLYFTYNLSSNSFCISPQSVTKFLPSGASVWSLEASGHEHGSQIQPRWLVPGAWDQSVCTSVSLKETRKNGIKEKGRERKELPDWWRNACNIHLQSNSDIFAKCQASHSSLEF